MLPRRRDRLCSLGSMSGPPRLDFGTAIASFRGKTGSHVSYRARASGAEPLCPSGTPPLVAVAGGARLHDAGDVFRELFRAFPGLVSYVAPVEDLLATGYPHAFLRHVLLE